jgi:hypothetical protein
LTRVSDHCSENTGSCQHEKKEKDPDQYFISHVNILQQKATKEKSGKAFQLNMAGARHRQRKSG